VLTTQTVCTAIHVESTVYKKNKRSPFVDQIYNERLQMRLGSFTNVVWKDETSQPFRNSTI